MLRETAAASLLVFFKNGEEAAKHVSCAELPMRRGTPTEHRYPSSSQIDKTGWCIADVYSCATRGSIPPCEGKFLAMFGGKNRERLEELRRRGIRPWVELNSEEAMLQSTSKRQQDRALDNGRVPFAPSLEENTGSTQLRRSRVREVASSLSSPSSSSSQQRASSRPDGLWPSLNKEESSKVDEKAVRSSRKNLEQAENEKPRDNLFEQSTTSTKAVFACNKPGAMPICKSVNLSSTKNKTSSRKSPAPSSSRTHAPAATKAYSNPKCMSMSVNGSLGSPQYVVQRWSESGGNFTTKKKPSHRKLLSSTITGNEVDENLHHHEPAASDSTPLTKTTPSCEEFPVRPRSPFRTPSPGTFPSPSRTLPSPPSSRPSSSHGSPVKRAAAEQDEAQLLKVLHNRHLQWRFVNARAHAALSSQEAAAKRLLFNAWARICDLRTVVAMDQIKLDKATESLKLASVLESHEKGLEEWSRLEDKLSSTLDEMVGALNADVLRVPLCRGAKGDALIIYGALQHASLILESVEASTYHLLPKAQEQSLLAQDLAQTVALEKASVRECKQLLERIASLEIEERSLRAHGIQLQQRTYIEIHFYLEAMAVMSKKVATAAPLVILGLWTAKLIFEQAEVSMSSIAAGCPDSVTYPFRFGNHAIDRFICVLVFFFKTALDSSLGLWISGYLLSVAISTFAFIAVEASRYGHAWLLSLTPIYAFLFQVGGISVVVPALWLPIYILSNAAERSPRHACDKTISSHRAVLIQFALLFFEIISVAMVLPLKNVNKDLAIFLFQFAPIVCPIFWLPITTTKDSDPASGHKAVVHLHFMQAGKAAVWHIVAILLVLDDPEIPSKALQLLWHHPGDLWCSFFLLIDCLVLFAAMVYLTAVEDGTTAALCILLGVPILGPGACLSMYFAYREDKFLETTIKRTKNKHQ
ncbi:hypothetical protein SELMODRAFT_421082 [Selaginella moellendorffii]|uniref:Uncharacterized protein n=1 Tax=Selaginella moellendorffii TaxID=88036 RepID=D8SE29_SELML|nr:hypothetical protein SELMODRAFT_421082 [Selaginella moellendorffii]